MTWTIKVCSECGQNAAHPQKYRLETWRDNCGGGTTGWMKETCSNCGYFTKQVAKHELQKVEEREANMAKAREIWASGFRWNAFRLWLSNV